MTIKKRDCPSNDSVSTSKETTPKRTPLVPRPVDDARDDTIDHWPFHIENKQKCKLCMKVYSRLKCIKCNKSLCLTKDKNCFLKYHMK
ncbi:hypothetical protein ANN_14257 [Periplaneta americana]|uniref:PiggyBac transposable element-derived protein 4 C-terminal zinc-ribbon domain-containing protein n=1 Tax=Periplaneta americana TaxID=6978 RepID=A0ABQ8SXY8_PERAM|nr:hypothetical protein ANN_14257 [Periplaneta americana]